MNLSSAGTNVSGDDGWGDAHRPKLTSTFHTVPTRLGYGLLAMSARWHRPPLRFEIRKRRPSSLQSVLGVLLHPSDVSIEEDTVDLEHAMVRRMWRSHIPVLPERDGRIYAFGFRTEVDGRLVETVHTKDS